MTEGLFESFYQSPIQHPILLWIANLIGTFLALRVNPAQKRFIVFWALISALDAWLSANRVYGIGVLQGPWASVIPFVFVWLGDFRIWIGMESGRITARSIGACFVVPILAGLLTLNREPRVLYLVYESLFLVWITAYSKLTRLDQIPKARTIRNLSLLFYTFWVISDVLILFLPHPLHDLGFAMRVIPNLIYYGSFGLVYAWAGPALHEEGGSK